MNMACMLDALRNAELKREQCVGAAAAIPCFFLATNRSATLEPR